VVTSSISRFDPSAQSSRGAHRGRVCGCAFVGVSVCACVSVCVCTMFFLKKIVIRVLVMQQLDIIIKDFN
jgi:Tfp pilus assembly protein PilN